MKTFKQLRESIGIDEARHFGFYAGRGGYDSSLSAGKRDFKAREMEHELGHETPKSSYSSSTRKNRYVSVAKPKDDIPHKVIINDKPWKTFSNKSHAENVARKIEAKGEKVRIEPAE